MTAIATNTELVSLRLEELHESPLNPRQHFDHDALVDLAASLRKGQLTPVLVRPRPAGGYELAAGHRRLRAAKLGNVHELLAIVRPMEDAEFLEILTIENLQREDVSPLEEAAGFKALQDQGGYDVPTIATKIGKSKEYVYGRLKLLELDAKPRKLVEQGKLTAGHAILLARLQPEDQRAVVEEATRYADREQPISVRELNRHIENQVRERNRTEAIAAVRAKAEAEHPKQKIHRLSSAYHSGDSAVIDRYGWKECKAGAEGALLGVLEPGSYGNEKPKLVHFTKVAERQVRSQPAYGSKAYRAAQRKREEQERQALRKKRAEAAGAIAVVSSFEALPTEILRPLAKRVCHSFGVHEVVELELLGHRPKKEAKHHAYGLRSQLIKKASPRQLVAAITYAVVHDQPTVLATLAKQAGVDLKAVSASAVQALQPSAKPVPNKRAGDIAKRKRGKR